MRRLITGIAVLMVVLAAGMASAVEPQIYWTDTSNPDAYGAMIKRANGDGSGLTTLVSGQYHLRGIAVDAQHGKMYWASSAVWIANLNGSNPTPLIGLGGGGGGVALDVQGGKMYWTDSQVAVNGRILRANLDGTSSETLVTGLVHPGAGIALDLQHGMVYWSDLATDKIQRANLNGPRVVEDFLTGIDEANGLAIDVSGGQLYWTATLLGKIQRKNLDNTGVIQDVVTGLNYPTTVSLDLSGGKMYWTEFDAFTYSNSRIQRASLDGSGREIVGSSADVGMPWGIAIADVPEPSTFILLGIGAMSLVGFAWRRRKTA